MELKTNDEHQKPVSMLEGDGFPINRILARELSKGQSSRIFYREAEGVPFQWEMQPGTPKNPREEDAIPPVTPSPLMQSLLLPLPNLDHDEPQESTSKAMRLKKMVTKRVNIDVIKVVLGRRRRSKKNKESSMFGDSNGDHEFVLKDSSFFSSSSSSSSFSPNMDTIALDTSPFCCSPWNVPAILEEGSSRIYYCSQHKAAFAVEEDGSFLSRILSRVSTGDQFSGDISPTGVPNHPPENELIPPPSPPPAVQSSSLPRPRVNAVGETVKKPAWKRAWFWLRRHDGKKGTGKMQHEISFRGNGMRENCRSDRMLRFAK